MKPLNKKERTGFILKFSASFVAGILILLIPFYFILRMPGYENAMVTKDCNDMQKLLEIQKNVFAVQIDSVLRMVSRYDIEDNEVLNGKLGILIGEMGKPYGGDTTWSGKMHSNIIKLIIDLKRAKTDKNSIEKELKETKEELQKAKDDAAKTKEKDSM